MTTLLGADARLLPGAARLARLHAAEIPQKDELCGCFTTLLALRLAGVEVPDQDAVAEVAGSVLADVEDHTTSLPAGERGRRDYRLALPAIADESRSGTAAGGLVRAVAQLSAGALVALPVAGPWTRESVEALYAAAGREELAALVLNVATRFFWGTRPSVLEVVEYLETGDASAGPAAEWDVGHFVGSLGSIRGPNGALAIVTDTYPSLGDRGVYLQPFERLADALRREGMTAGGALVVAPAAREKALRQALAGFELDVWDNGSPDVRAG